MSRDSREPHRPRFEPIEHMADAGITAYGNTLAELFEAAALGMYAITAGEGTVAAKDYREITVAARDVEGLLVAWLAELLYYTDAEEMLFCRFDIHEIDETDVVATVWGDRIDAKTQELLVGVKGVTRHMLEVTCDEDGYQATVLFDI